MAFFNLSDFLFFFSAANSIIRMVVAFNNNVLGIYYVNLRAFRKCQQVVDSDWLNDYLRGSQPDFALDYEAA